MEQKVQQPFSTPDVCDACPGVHVLAPVFKHYGLRTCFSGEVVTIKCFEDNSLVKSQLHEPGEGRVLVVDGGGSFRCAMLGDRLARMASDNGWSGVVLNGCVRDVEIIADIDIGIKALGVHPRKSVKHGVGEVNVPVFFAEAHVIPGKFMYADLNGIVIADRNVMAENVC